MTWKEFKQQIETFGVKDDSKIVILSPQPNNHFALAMERTEQVGCRRHLDSDTWDIGMKPR